MKRIIYFLITVIFVSCANKSYVYDVRMTHPVQSKELSYENDTLRIDFDIDIKSIKFNLLNKTNEGMKINWDEVSFSFNGKAQRVVHNKTGVDRITEVQPPTTIPPKALLEDRLFSTNSLLLTRDRYGNKNPIFISMFPINDYGNKKTRKRVMALKGTQIVIFMPYYLGPAYVNQYYNLFIHDIKIK